MPDVAGIQKDHGRGRIWGRPEAITFLPDSRCGRISDGIRMRSGFGPDSGLQAACPWGTLTRRILRQISARVRHSRFMKAWCLLIRPSSTSKSCGVRSCPSGVLKTVHAQSPLGMPSRSALRTSHTESWSSTKMSHVALIATAVCVLGDT